MGTTESFVNQFENASFPDFKATMPFTCSYEMSTPPAFKTELSELTVEIGVIKSFVLPEILPGSLSLREVKFIPDSSI